MSDNYFTNQSLESALIGQQNTNPLQAPAISGSNLISPQTIAFVDQNISDAMTVMSNTQADIKVLLDPTKDGIAQITETLGLYKNLKGIDIISHGNIAQLQLGNSSLNASTLTTYSAQLQRWSQSLATGADILLYGCDVALGEIGQSFVKSISDLTGADVAASTNLTGNSHMGGDWNLEYSTGNIETSSPFSSSLINSYQDLLASIFTNQTPVTLNATDGTGSAGDYELGMEFQSAKAGTISAIRYYKAASETGTHVGRIWSSTGTLLASVTFTNETASGWQQQTLATPLTIAANTKYVVSVNANQYYVATTNGIATTITNGDLSAVADGSNGVYNVTPSAFPTQSYQNSNYFRDIVFTPTASNPNNRAGTVAITGTATQNQTLTANVTDADGLTGASISYQWQQSSNGSTWTNISGATNQTFSLTQAQVNQQVRVTATYTDALGTNETPISTASTSVVNVNDLGSVAINGVTAQGNTLTANVTDPDGLTGVTVSYQWQQSSDNGVTWNNITGATNQTLTLDSSLVGKKVGVKTTYVDALGGSENIFNSTVNPISALLESIFSATTTPSQPNFTDGVGVTYELGMKVTSTKAGQIQAIRYYKSPSETGTHVGKIWSSTGTLLASVTFTNETASGWQQQALATPLAIAANATVVVSVNSNGYYASTLNQFSSAITNGDLSAPVGAGVYNTTLGSFPSQVYQNEGYFRDIVFTPTASNPNNRAGTVAITGTATQNQTLTANVTDADGLTGASISYQWQQSSNGSTWTNISGATNQTFSLTQAQVNQQVRVTATYTDALGTNETPISTASTSVVNVNDLGSVAINGVTAQGNTLTANVTDPDGLTGVTVSYQWQQSSDNGVTWNNITGATNQTLTLDSSLVGKKVGVKTTYVDALGGSENIFNSTVNPISALLESIFSATTTPSQPNFTDGVGVTYELGMKVTSTKAGQIQAIRYYKSPSETGTHVGKIWSSTGTLLASVTFTNETASGWQQQALATPLAIAANATVVVSVNSNGYYASTLNQFSSAITNGDLSAPVGAGVYNTTLGSFPSQVYQNEGYFRDIVFTPTASNPNNRTGTVAITGTATQNQTLTANVTDADGLTGASISYQWQQSSNGSTWTNISGATNQTFSLTQAQVNQQVRVTATYTDALGTNETPISAASSAIVNVNDLGSVILKGSATVGATLDNTVLDTDGLNGVTIGYQWQQFVNNLWSNIAGATSKSITLSNALLGQQVRLFASYIDALGTSENVASSAITIAAQNEIVLENQKTGTNAWQISATNQATTQIVGYADATSINQGEAINLKISLAQAGQYSMNVYRLGYYGGAGGRLMKSVTGLSGVVQAGPTIDPNTRLVEYKWNTSYTLQTGSDWTSGLYLVKLTDSTTGKQNYIQFVLRDDSRPADIGFQDAIATAEAYNNYGGYSVYDFNSLGGQRAYQVSFDRPFQYNTSTSAEQFNNTLTWEYNMTRWLESQGYDVSYYSSIDVSINPLLLYSQKTYLSVGHDEYWSKDQRDNVEKARDNGINLAFFSANTAYWQVRYDASSTGQANRVMTIYKDSSGVGTNASLDPIAQTNPTAATTLFRSAQVNRPENALLGVGYIGDIGATGVYQGFDFVVSNASDPYYANTGLKNGDKLIGLVGYEYDGLLNNGLAPAGLVVLSQSTVPSSGLGALGLLPSGTNDTISSAVRYTAASGAKVFAVGSIQWVWGLDSFGVTNPRVDRRAQQIAVNIFADMGAKPQTPDIGIVV